jgi:hypothetical protein
VSDIEPIAVALKFGFIAVLYLFLFWVARAALRDLGGSSAPAFEGTGFHEPVQGRNGASNDAWLIVEAGGGLDKGERFDLFGGLSIGRSTDADVRVDDRYASGVHARVFNRGGDYFVEDLNSTNGTLLNSEQLHGEAALADGDLIRIGDTEFRFVPEVPR